MSKVELGTRQGSEGFVRIKWIKGLPYRYKVRSVWINGTCKQVHIAYLGRAEGIEGKLVTRAKASRWSRFKGWFGGASMR